jgi:hypothetical protein
MKAKIAFSAVAALMLSTVMSLAQGSMTGPPATPPALPAIPVGNHYVCYPVQSDVKPVPRTVTFTDQFGTITGIATNVTRICVPAAKRYKDKVYEATDTFLHLVCYAFRAQGRPLPLVVTNDQFGPQRLKLAPPNEVCLPAGKTPLKG